MPLSSIPCPTCSANVAADSRFCNACGNPVSSLSQMPTGAGAAAAPAAAPPVSRISSDSIPTGGFTPGAVLADRYRIIGLLGRGGMGEVYRADDLKLGQPVALKFLPKAFASDPVRRERFFAEVRITRQLAHPNICRVYDIAEYEGLHFLSMEYIDGEDLASLIKRIGYLSNEKALEITRQLAAGLAAAHERGVLHRDLKPANVMIDGHGRVRITDFGLAIAVGDDAQEAEILGTPAYMAPEQFAGKGASVRSDIYSLGLILYELYSGKRAFTATTVVQIREQKEGHTPTSPSEIRTGLDPVVERLIMRCLERDPRARPSSVAQLAVALPGGDPLAAAIAAGETPSPEMVAAAGMKEGLRPAVAIALLAFAIMGSIAALWMKGSTDVLQRVSASKPRDVLIERAREIIRKAGYTDPPADSALSFGSNTSFLRYLEEDTDKSASRWNRFADFDPINAIYRQSPRDLERMGPFLPQSPGVTSDDPPMQFSGEIRLSLDTDGRLRAFDAIPPQAESSAAPASPPDWSLLFSEAGLALSDWTPVNPQRTPRFFSDQRAAWQGSWPGFTGIPIRIEAAAHRGKPVSFEIIGPWSTAERDTPLGQRPGARIAAMIGAFLVLTVIAAGIYFARRNLRLGRGDRRSALKVVLFFQALMAIAWILTEHHVAGFWEFGLLVLFAGVALLIGSLLWVLYVALEPFVRRRWPHMLISWSRLLSGEWKDPFVGRDILIGGATGIGMALFPQAANTLTATLLPYPIALGSSVFWIAHLCSSGMIALVGSLLTIFLVFVFRLITRNDVAAAATLVAVLTLPTFANEEGIWIHLPFMLVFYSLSTVILMRFGLLSFVVAGFFNDILNSSPITLQTSAWYSGSGFATLAVLAAITLYGFRVSVGSRPLLDIAAAED